jgi:signal transduction histidine kinase
LIRDKQLSADARENAESIRLEVSSMMRLILNLLDINRGEEGELTPALSEVRLKALTEDVLVAIRPRAKAKAIELEGAVDESVALIRADPDLLRRVLENLVENALRYAPTRSTVTLSARRQGEVIELRVTDRGKGVPEAMRATVFDRFVQLGPAGRDDHRTGRGLGLTFCRLAVEAHGGRIFVEDADPGAAFCVQLPT